MAAGSKGALSFDIGARAFENCGKNAKVALSVDFGDEIIRSIGSRAFAGTNIKELDFSQMQGLKSLGSDVFASVASIDEIVIGDNDTLAAIVSESINADKLILLSDIDGLYTADPHTHPEAKLIHVAHQIDDDIIALAGGSSCALGTGGMITKLQAAKICLACGCDMVITNGNTPTNLYDILEGKQIGTTFTVNP